MADLSVTAASVLASSQAQIERSYNAGATLTAGQAVYLNSSNLWVANDANIAAAGAIATKRGIALNGAANGQPIAVVLSDPGFTPGATLTVGQTYAVSANAAMIAPISDLTTGDYPQLLFIATSTTVANMQPFAGGTIKP